MMLQILTCSNCLLIYVARSISYAAVVLWNDLCHDDMTKSDSVAVARLKTHLFSKYSLQVNLSPF